MPSTAGYKALLTATCFVAIILGATVVGAQETLGDNLISNGCFKCVGRGWMGLGF